jgi:hypothetical protein
MAVSGMVFASAGTQAVQQRTIIGLETRENKRYSTAEREEACLELINAPFGIPVQVFSTQCENEG